MPRTADTPVPFSRLLELAEQADRQQRARITAFLTPPEAELAMAAGKRARVNGSLFGGYEGAERQMARFSPDGEPDGPFPITAIEITWPHQQAPGHRDLLGSVMALGLDRSRIGDIVLLPDKAYLFAEATLAGEIARGLMEAGHIRLSVRLTDTLPELPAPEGEAMAFTVQSPRLDAVVADGFHLSRGSAAELITSGAVKLRYVPTLRPDARVEEGDAISVRGYGRLRVDGFGETTRKGRLPVKVTRFGTNRA